MMNYHKEKDKKFYAKIAGVYFLRGTGSEPPDIMNVPIDEHRP